MADRYEREHMAGLGEVLHREKATVPRGLLAVCVALPAVVGAVVGTAIWLSTGIVATLLAPWGSGTIVSIVMAAVMLLFMSARLVVSEGGLSVQLGFAGPRVRIEDIAAVERGRSGRRGWGLGVRATPRTTIVSMFGDNDRAVVITRRDGTKLVIVTREADALEAALREALARRDRPRLRAADPEALAADVGEPESAEVARASDTTRSGDTTRGA